MRRVFALALLSLACTTTTGGPAKNIDYPDSGDWVDGGCTAETAQQTCQRLGLGCGMQDAVDNCGVAVRVTCLCNPDGGLAACAAGQLDCDGGCSDPTDVNSCGICGNVCPATGSCKGGFCHCDGGGLVILGCLGPDAG